MTVVEVPRIYPIAHFKTFSADYWLRRATMTHNKAAGVHDPKLQQRLKRVALEYERLATHLSANSQPHHHSPRTTNSRARPSRQKVPR